LMLQIVRHSSSGGHLSYAQKKCEVKTKNCKNLLLAERAALAFGEPDGKALGASTQSALASIRA